MDNMPNNGKNRFQTMGVLLLCVGMVWLGSVVMGSFAANPVSSQEELSGIDRKKLGLMEMIAGLQTALANDQLELGDQVRQSYEDKIKSAQQELTEITEREQLDPTDLWNRKQTLIAEVTKNPIQRKPTNTEEPLPKLLQGPIGIMPYAREAVLMSVWVDHYNDTYLTVATGHMRSQKDQGVIYILIDKPRTAVKYFLPEKTGMVTITSFDGDHLYLQTATGGTFTFNWRTHTLIDENQKIVELIDASPQTTPQPAYP